MKLRHLCLSVVVLVTLPTWRALPRGSASQPECQYLDGQIPRLMREWGVPGLAVAVVKEGRVAFVKGQGLRDTTLKLPVTPQTLFAIASCTKSFTAAAIGVMIDEGKLSWDTPIESYKGDIRFSDAYVSSHITIRDLLTHRSGLPQHYRMYWHSPLSRQEIVQRVRYLDLGKEFRTSFLYSNLNYVIAARLMEQVAGESWEDVVRNRLLFPLRMERTGFLDATRIDPNLARPYREEAGALKEVSYFDAGAAGPAGSVMSTALDMSRWLTMLANGGTFEGRRVLSEAGLREMHTPQNLMSPSASDEMFYSSYGMGWAVTSYRGHVLASHGGGFDGFSAMVALLPREHAGVAVLANLEGSPLPGVLTNVILDRILGSSAIDWNQRAKDRVAKAKLAGLGSPAPDWCGTKADLPRDLGQYTGLFRHPAYGTITVTRVDDGLEIGHNGLTAGLRYCGGDIFETVGHGFGRFKVRVSRNGIVRRTAVDFEPAVRDIEFRR